MLRALIRSSSEGGGGVRDGRPYDLREAALSLSLSHTHTPTPTHPTAHTLSLFLSISLTHTFLSLSLSHTHTLSLSLSLDLSLLISELRDALRLLEDVERSQPALVVDWFDKSDLI